MFETPTAYAVVLNI